MSDNSYGTVFGPSTPGLINLVSGQTNGVTNTLNGTGGNETDGGMGSLTVIGDPDPIGDVCSAPTRGQVQMAGRNIGDLLNDAGVTWGAFMGGFDLTATNSNGTTGACEVRLPRSPEQPATTFRTTLSSSTALPPPTRRTRGPVRCQRSDTTAPPIISTT